MIFGKDCIDLPKLNVRDFQAILEGRQHAILEVAELFFGILVVSLIENLHRHEEPDIFIESGAQLHGGHIFSEEIREYFIGYLPASKILTVDLRDIGFSLMAILGSGHGVNSHLLEQGTCLIRLEKGQVSYLSFLKTLSTSGKQIFSVRVY